MSVLGSSQSQIILRSRDDWGPIQTQEVRLHNGQPTLCRKWGPNGVRVHSPGVTVHEMLSEPDTAIAASFRTFVPSTTRSKTWFTYLCDGDTVLALAMCSAPSAERRDLQQLRDNLNHAAVEDLAQDVDGFDATQPPFHVIITKHDTVQSVSGNAPDDPPLSDVLQALLQAHRLSHAEVKWQAWIPGYNVTFHAMRHPTATTLATLTPVGRAPVPQLAHLTPAQAKVVRYAANGSTAPEIARSLDRSVETVRSHLRASYHRLQVCSRVELIPSAAELSLWGAQ